MLFLVWYSLLCVLSSFAIILTRKRRERENWLPSFYCKCSVALPHGTVGWSTVCDRCISFSYSLTFLYLEMLNYSILILIMLAVVVILNYFKHYLKDSTVYKSVKVLLAFTPREAIMTINSSRINHLQVYFSHRFNIQLGI